MPVRIDLPQPALSRTTSIETAEDYPDVIEVRAIWRQPGRRAKVQAIEIPADQFFGRGRHGAPLSGDALIAMVDRLRRMGPGR